jgi:hypothetical protein
LKLKALLARLEPVLSAACNKARLCHPYEAI